MTTDYPLNWDTLRAVLAVARVGSLNSAARELGINQATVGRHLKRAEMDLGAKLFDRYNYGLEPTAAGLTAITVAETVEREIIALSRKVKGADDAEEGTIRISVPVGLMPHGLTDDLHAFRMAFPKVTLEILATDTPLGFVERDVDIFIRAADNPSSGLWGHKLTEMQFGFFATQKVLEKWLDEVAEETATATLPYVARSTSDPSRDFEGFRAAYPAADRVMTCNDLESLLALILSGVGVGRLPFFIANRFETLVCFQDAPTGSGPPLWVLTYPDLRETKRIRSLMDLLLDRFKDREDAFRAKIAAPDKAN